MRRLLFLTAVAACGVAFGEGTEGEELLAQKANNSWHFTIGPVMAPRVRVKVRGPRQIPIRIQAPQGSFSSGSGDGASVADPSAGYVDRQYTDGYVKPDEGTSDPDSIISGLTWNWGANDVPGQYVGGAMEFRTDMARWSESISSSSYGGGAFSGYDSDRDFLVGVEAMGGWTFFSDERFDAAIDAGLRFYGSGDQKAESMCGTSVTTTRTRNEYRYVDSYDASGWTYVPSGSHTGTAGGPGRILGAVPTRREEMIGATSYSTSEDYSYFYRTSTKLDYRIWDIKLGPTFGWKAMDALTLRGGVYGLLGLVDAELSNSGTLSRTKKSKCDAVFGVAAGVSAQFNITDSLFLLGGAEYDWWSDDVTLNAGGSDAKIKLSDFTVSLALGIEF